MKAFKLGVAGAAVVCALLASANAQAQGGGKTYDWTGFYVGVGGGLSAHSYDQLLRNGITGNVASARPRGGHGAFATVSAGYDIQATPGLVIGVFADYDWGGGEDNLSCPLCDGFAPTSFERSSAWALGGRVGVLATPSTLIYATAGYTQARYNWDSRHFTFRVRDSARNSDTAAGVFFGLGTETMLFGNWSLRGEYRYAWSDDSMCSGSSSGQTTSLCRNFNNAANELYLVDRPVEQSLRATLSYRFGAETGKSAGASQNAAPARAHNWTGLYLGGGLGYGAVDFDWHRFSGITGEKIQDDQRAGRGVLGSAIVGFDWQASSQFVVGAFAEYERSALKAQVDCPVCPTQQYEFQRDSAWSVGARVGWLPTATTLIYVPVGYTRAHYEWDGTFFSGSFNRMRAYEDSAGGYFAGLGLETALSRNWSFRTEYRYTAFDDKICVASSVSQTISTCKGTNDVNPGSQPQLIEKLTEHSARAVLSYKFN